MIRMIFFLTLITMLVVYVPDNVRQNLKNTITFAYKSADKFIDGTFPECSDKLNHLLSKVENINIQKIDHPREQKQINKHPKNINIKKDNDAPINEKEPQIDIQQFREFYKINRDKLIELMNMLEESDNDKN